MVGAYLSGDSDAEKRALSQCLQRIEDLRHSTSVADHDRFYLSYVMNDAQTGDKLNPSPMLHALMRHLYRKHAGQPSEKWVKDQPLHRSDDAYFPRSTVQYNIDSL